MKTILLIVISIFTLETSFSQTAADYYLPQCEGNYLELYTPGGSEYGWAARTTFYSIIRSDSINGKLYFLEKGFEILDDNPTDTLVFHCFWLREDSVGNILIGAGDFTNTGVLDSATIINPPGPFFPNQYLTVGYSQSYSFAGDIFQDSVISISASAGGYTNCIQIRSTRRTGDTIVFIKDEYYANHLGMVKDEISYPDNEVANLVDYLASDCYTDIPENSFGNKNEVSIFPNPSNGKFTITYPSATREIQISNSLGKIIQTKYVDNETNSEFELSENGIYLIQIKTDKQTITKKLIICK